MTQRPRPGRGSTSQSQPTSIVDVLEALAFASDLGSGQPEGHVVRTVGIAMTLAERLALSADERLHAFYVSFLAHSGCTGGTKDLLPFTDNEMVAYGQLFSIDPSSPADVGQWLARNLPSRSQGKSFDAAMSSLAAVMPEHTRGVCEVGHRFAERLGLPDETAMAVKYVFEFWDGSGPFGLQGLAIPAASRIALAALTFDSLQQTRDWTEAQAVVAQRSGTMLDPAIAGVLRTLEAPEKAGETGGQELGQQLPESVHVSNSAPLTDDRLEEVALAFADFADIKGATTLRHSRTAARLAVGMANRIGLPESDVRELRQAALIHDLGCIAAPIAVLHGQRQPSVQEQEMLRLHPYYTERILSRVPAFIPAARLASTHHEMLDGSGSFRGLAARELPLPARILAVADRYDEMADDFVAADAENRRAVVGRLQSEFDGKLDRDCIRALSAELEGARSRTSPRHTWPKGLTTREVEVLRLISRGMTNREMAAELTLSDRTVARHIENIYNKLGVSSRAASTLFAMENDLL